MATRTLKRTVTFLFAATGVLLSLVALFLLSITAQNSGDFDRLHNLILAINVAGVLVLLALMVGNLVRLYREWHDNVPGARLKARMVSMFVGLAVLPLLVVFYFSVQFLNRGIDTWFNVEVEEGLDNAVQLSRAALELQMRDNLSSTQRIARLLRAVSEREFIFELSMLRRESGASEITLFGPNQQILATSSDSSAAALPTQLRGEVILQLQQDRPFVSLDPLDAGAYEVRTAVPFYSQTQVEPIGVLQAHFPVTSRLGRMANSVENSYQQYQNLLFLRGPLKSTFTMTLSVVLLLSLLTSIYGAFVVSRRLVQPIQQLVCRYARRRQGRIRPDPAGAIARRDRLPRDVFQ
jgi:nitrogen fixation/metabolism regulation signal transduction histidine kinase